MGSNFGPMVNQFGMVNPAMDSNMMMGQMMYNAGSMPSSAAMMQMPSGMMSGTRQMPAYNQMQPQMMGVTQNAYARPRGQAAPTFPGYQGPDRPVKLEPTQTTVQSVKAARSAPQVKIKSVPKAPSAAASVVRQDTDPLEEPAPEIPVATGPSPAEMLMGASAGGNDGGKAKGRDYLMELLKK
jgi:hypothetical protein